MASITHANSQKIAYTMYVVRTSCILVYFRELRIEVLNGVALIYKVDATQTTQRKVVFRSQIFPSSFGAGILVLPNTIDFKKVFDDALQKFLDTIHVTATVVGFLIIYFSILPVAWRRDRRDWRNVRHVTSHPCFFHHFSVEK